ncbi:MAG TPA: trehalose-phosphatase [Micromonosporaceae bacterium]|nr:trehalose-phosphatase [Micromonosporaceae bacterium]
MPPTTSGSERSDRRHTAETAVSLTASRIADAAFFFDFDGTLAPISDDPNDVRLTPGVLDAITALSQRVRRIVIVSARPASFLFERFGELPDVSLYGLYGLEVHRNGKIETDPDALAYAGQMEQLAERARAELPAAVLVEYKRLSVALHYRTAPELADTVRQWAERQHEELGLPAQHGRMVAEIKPPVERNKGNVVLDETRDGISCAWYFGDDVSDLKAFRALDELAAADPAFLGVRVAVTNLETGADLAAAADFSLATPTEVAKLLTEIAAA